MEMIFKDILEYEGLYQISNYGNIKSLKKKIILTNRLNNTGYYRIQLSKDGNRKKYFVHKLVAINFIPNLENKPEVNHKDGNKLNNRVDNLEWCTHKENMIHYVKNELTLKGEKHKRAKLKRKDIFNIKSMLANNISQQIIANIYKVNSTCISKIKTRVSWKHLV